MRKSICSCGKDNQYIPKHDAYACMFCNKWHENKCIDDKCEFCSTRPNKPFKD